MGLKEFIPFLHGKEVVAEKRDEVQKLRDKIRIYEFIIGRYRDLIAREEAKTIADLKALIKPSDETIMKVRDGLVEGMRPYLYEQNFLAAAKKAHEFVAGLYTEITPIDFWLTPKEMLELKGGDPMDKALLLCSLLVALENTEAYVIVGTDKGIRVGVGFNFKDDFYLFDPTSDGSEKGEKDKIIEEWFEGDKQIYEFNDREYTELKPQE